MSEHILTKKNGGTWEGLEETLFYYSSLKDLKIYKKEKEIIDLVCSDFLVKGVRLDFIVCCISWNVIPDPIVVKYLFIICYSGVHVKQIEKLYYKGICWFLGLF